MSLEKDRFMAELDRRWDNYQARKQQLEALGLTVDAHWEHDNADLLRDPDFWEIYMDWTVSRIGSKFKASEILDLVAKDELFGVVVCDIQVINCV